MSSTIDLDEVECDEAINWGRPKPLEIVEPPTPEQPAYLDEAPRRRLIGAQTLR
jgi:hypothetical protein